MMDRADERGKIKSRSGSRKTKEAKTGEAKRRTMGQSQEQLQPSHDGAVAGAAAAIARGELRSGAAVCRP